jgi:hypothetical protein
MQNAVRETCHVLSNLCGNAYIGQYPAWPYGSQKRSAALSGVYNICFAIGHREGVDAIKRPYSVSAHCYWFVLHKLQGRLGLVVCDMEFTGLTQRLWVRGDSTRGPSYANILSGRFLFIFFLTNEST